MEVMLFVSFKIQENELKKYMIDISKGNELALEQFYEKYGQLLLALIYSIVKNRESSEEALQDVLMAIVNRNADNPMENARGWLFKVIKNLSQKKAKEDWLMENEAVSENDEMISVDSISDHIDNSVDYIEALDALDEIEQQCVMLHIFYQMKLPQVAKTLGMPYKKVCNKYDYAIRKLKKYYEEGKCQI